MVPATLLVLLLSPAAAPIPAPIAIVGVTVVDPSSDTPQPGMTVRIQDGRITSVVRSEGAPASGPDVRVVDGRGKFLIPGLWDMHVHLSWTRESALPVLIANGVTGVRDLGSDLAEIDAWRARIAAGALVGPRIVRAGPILNGRSSNRYQLVTGDPEQARGIVRALKQVGVDLIKVHRRVPREDYFAIVDEAKRQGLPLVGHIPMTVTPEEASDAGELIEHTETLFEGTFSAGLKDDELPDAIRRWRADGADALFARFVRNHTTVTPVLVAWQYLVDHPGASWQDDPRMRYVARSFREDARRKPPPVSAEELPLLKRTVAEYRETVRQMQRAGVTLLAGTDIAAIRIPGIFLHEELAVLVDSGLTPLEALRAATRNPAAVLGREKDYGAVQAGRIADLVLLDADPLRDIHNTQRIAAVVVDGRLLLRADLDALLALGAQLAERN
jgi:imidazolonepropionase-like amidohydrolase